MKTLPLILSAIIVSVAMISEAAAQCVTRSSSQGTCSASLAVCSQRTQSTTLAGCRAAHAECMRIGRWIYRHKEGNCVDWGVRRKE